MEQKTKVEMSKEEQELFNEQYKADLDNAQVEAERTITNIKEHEFVLDMMKKQLSAFKGAKDIIVNGCEPLEPMFKYEKEPEYIDYLKVAKKLEVEQFIFKLEQQSIPSMEKTIEAKYESLASLTEKLGGSNE